MSPLPMRTLSINHDQLARLGTCILVVDKNGVVVLVSDCLQRLIEVDVVGKNIVTLGVDVDYSAATLDLHLQSGDVLPLRGQWITTAGKTERVFVGSPAPATAHDATRLGLIAHDFPEHDTWMNYLKKEDEAATSQQHSNERIVQLKKERRRLAETRDEMCNARKAALNMLKDLEVARSKAETAARTKSEFLANMSHEIRTPMTAILGYAECLLDPSLPKSERRQAVDTIHRNGKHLLQIINDVLDLSKIESGMITVERLPCDPVRVVNDVVTLLRDSAESKGLSLAAECVCEVPRMISTDPTRLRQVLLNIVGNAIKFTEKGSVRVVCGLDGCDQEPTMRFDVVDTGIGMSKPQINDDLFQSFSQADASTTRRFGGTGLGLTISRRFARMLGGDVTVISSKANVGSHFRITIAAGPLEELRHTHQTAKTHSQVDRLVEPAELTDKKQLPPCRILLAEDGVDNQRLFARILEKAGCEVTIADNGQIATILAIRADRDGMPFDTILMDMQMPVMDGYLATRHLRSNGYTEPIVALTAHTMEGDKAKCLQAGCDAYASKPITRDALVHAVRIQLDRKQADVSS